MTDTAHPPHDPTIVFIGDSVTARVDWQKWFPDASVVNLGLDGNTTDGVIGQIEAVAEHEPAVISILIGTNDLSGRHSVEHLVRNVELLLVSLRRDLPEANVLVQSLLPRSANLASRIKDANRHLWQFAPGVGATWLDLWPVFAAEDGSILSEFSTDGVHLTDAGYEAWRELVAPAIEGLLSGA